MRESSRRTGELMIKDIVEGLGERARQLLDDYAKLQPKHKPLTFDQVEEIWDHEIRPLIKDFKAMKDLQSGQKPPPENSRWYANWHVKYQG